MVVTKSVSRFARNTVTLLHTVRELKTLGIDVFFEEQNIHTNSSEGEAGATVTLTMKPDEGMVANAPTAKTDKDASVPVAKNTDGTYSFVMPAANIIVSATFGEGSGDNGDNDNDGYGKCPQDNTCVYAKFTDSDTKAWYHDGVHFCVEKGYMNGVSATEFAPASPLSRGMIVTILYRMQGSPATDYGMTFADVEAGKWYTEAIRWALCHRRGPCNQALAPPPEVTPSGGKFYYSRMGGQILSS